MNTQEYIEKLRDARKTVVELRNEVEKDQLGSYWREGGIYDQLGKTIHALEEEIRSVREHEAVWGNSFRGR